MTSEEEHEFYGRPENQLPQGPARRRKQRMTDPVPVRFPRRQAAPELPTGE